MNTFVTKIISFSQQKKSYHFILPIPKNKIPRFLLFRSSSYTGPIVCSSLRARKPKPLLPSGPMGVRTRCSAARVAKEPERERGELSIKLPVRERG